MKISIGNDHAGTDYKFAIVKLLESKGINVTNYGTDSNDSVDYPDFVHPVAKDVVNKAADFGILTLVELVCTILIAKYLYDVKVTVVVAGVPKVAIFALAEATSVEVCFATSGVRVWPEAKIAWLEAILETTSCPCGVGYAVWSNKLIF